MSTWRNIVLLILLAAFGLAPFLVRATCLAKDDQPDCNKILIELEKGQSAEKIAKAMGIQTSSVYSCETKATKSIPSAPPSPGAMPSLSDQSH